MRLGRSSLVLALVVAAFAGSKPQPPSKETLDQITARGRRIAEYERAVTDAAGAVWSLNPPAGSVRRLIARKGDAGWTVAFGRSNDTGDAFLVAYEATEGKPGEYTAKKNEPPTEDRGFYLAAARAINLAVGRFQGEQRPYNIVILPEQEKLLVYVMPAQTKPNIYPLGGDARYITDAEGKTILEEKRLHNSIIEKDVRDVPKGTTPAAGFHTAVVSDLPEDTDVAHVLVRQPSVPEFIGTAHFMYKIETDGTITLEKK